MEKGESQDLERGCRPGCGHGWRETTETCGDSDPWEERRVGDRGEDTGIVFKLGEAVKEKFGSSDLVIGE